MWGKWATKLAIRLLRDATLGAEERQLLTATFLDKLGALPLRARITIDEAGQIFVNGKKLSLETARTLHDTSKTMLKNFARRFVREQVAFMAIHKGVHENTSPEQGLFAKAALWFMQEEDELYALLAQNEGEDAQ